LMKTLMKSMIHRRVLLLKSMMNDISP
jgi:hypothetical protein